MLAASSPLEEYGGSMWFPGQKKPWWTASPASSAAASTRVEQLARAREEMLSLLEDLPESERELSFSDMVVLTDQDKAAEVADVEEVVSVPFSLDAKAEIVGRPGDHEGRRPHEGAAHVKEGKDSGNLGASKRRRGRSRSRSGGGAAGSELQLAVASKTNRGNFSVGVEGVLLNLYMPCSLTRSLTTGSASSSSLSSRRHSSAGERPAAPTPTVSEEAQMAKLGCWSALWATKEKQHKTKGSTPRITEEKGKNGSSSYNSKKKRVQSVRRDFVHLLV